MDVIAAILEIDKQATDKLNQAQAQKDAIINEAVSNEESVKADIFEATNVKIKKYEEEEKAAAEKQFADIDAEKAASKAKLDEIYEKNHTQWEDTIINSIINTDA